MPSYADLILVNPAAISRIFLQCLELTFTSRNQTINIITVLIIIIIIVNI